MSQAKPRRFDRDVSGIVLLDKPVGITSNAALQQARTLFRALKAGHAGSLDPLASGMLPVCFGHATKICAFLLDAYKSYQFTARLGERRDTGDADGAIVEYLAVPPLTESQVKDELRANLGEQEQVPPMYSALKHQGQRLYELARRGEEVERAPRRIDIESLDLVRFNGVELEVVVRCSKGTYVRTLAEYIARGLGTVAHLIALRRLSVDPFAGERMVTMDELRERSARGLGALDELLMPADQALAHLPQVQVDAAGEQAVLHGQSVAGLGPLSGGWVRIYGAEHRFLGLGEATAVDAVQPRRIFLNSQ